MTADILLSMALAPPIPVAPIRGVAWQHRCYHCAMYGWCVDLVTAGLPLRCEPIDARERQRLQEAFDGPPTAR